MPELEVPPTDDQVIAYLRKIAETHEWDTRPMLFMIEWDGTELNCGTMVVLDLKQEEIPMAIMFFAAEALSKGELPYLFLGTFEGWMIQISPDATEEERATAMRQMRERQIHTRDDAVEQLILHGATVDGRNFTGTKSHHAIEVKTSTTTTADGEFVAALQSSATIAGQLRRGDDVGK